MKTVQLFGPPSFFRCLINNGNKKLKNKHNWRADNEQNLYQYICFSPILTVYRINIKEKFSKKALRSRRLLLLVLHLTRQFRIVFQFSGNNDICVFRKITKQSQALIQFCSLMCILIQAIQKSSFMVFYRPIFVEAVMAREWSFGKSFLFWFIA